MQSRCSPCLSHLPAAPRRMYMRLDSRSQKLLQKEGLTRAAVLQPVVSGTGSVVSSPGTVASGGAAVSARSTDVPSRYFQDDAASVSSSGSKPTASVVSASTTSPARQLLPERAPATEKRCSCVVFSLVCTVPSYTGLSSA